MNSFSWFKKSPFCLWIILICSVTFLIRLREKRQTDSMTKGYFWVFSDSHVDLFYRLDGDPASYCHNQSLNNTEKNLGIFGHYSCNPPIRLLLSAISAAKKIDPNVDFLIWLGDSMSHISPDDNTLITINVNFTQELRKHFPKTLIIPVLGNHDIMYAADRSIRFREFYIKSNYHLLLDDVPARETFLKGGFYSILSQTNLRFIALNTAMFQPQYSDYFDRREIIEQIEWFNQTISNASKNNERILLLAHTPFGMNEELLYRFYEIEYEQKLLKIIEKYSHCILMCLSGHRHRDSFTIYSSSNRTMGILGHPSITPIGRLTHPSIRRYSYHRKALVLIDYDQYSLDLDEVERTERDQWKFSYRFSSWYHLSKDLTGETLLELVDLIRRNSFHLKRFFLIRHQADQPQLTNHSIIRTLCALTLIHFDELLFCTRFFEKNHLHFSNFTLKNSVQTNVFLHEQSLEKTRLSRHIITVLSIVILIICCTLYRHLS